MSLNMEDVNFEQAMAELELTVKRLEEGKFPLEEAIAAFERGIQLKSFCENKLKQAKLRVDQIINSNDGKVTLQPFADVA